MKDKWLPPHIFVYVNGAPISESKPRPATTKKEAFDYTDDLHSIIDGIAVVMATSPDWDGGYTYTKKYVCDGYKKDCTFGFGCVHLGEHEFQNDACIKGGVCGGKKLKCRPVKVKTKPKIEEESPIKMEIIEVG